jgi:hypothetical protein
MAETQTTGIKNADELITLATAYGLTVTVEKTDRETLTSYVVRLAIPVPAAYAGTELGRAIAGDTLVMLWTKPNKGGRGRLDDATVWSTTSHRKVRTLRNVTAAVETLGRSSNKYARDAAPLPEDVVDAPHAVFVDGRQVHAGIPAAHVRTIVANRRFRGWLVHQDAENAICSDDRRYVPVQPAPAEETPAAERLHVRIANGSTPEILPSRVALEEINHAMMDGKRDVREMSEGRGNARIVYRDQRGTVELRHATAEDITAYAPAGTTDAKTLRWAEGFAAKWWAEQHTEEPTDAAMADAFTYTVKPPKPEMYPVIREAIAANMPPAAAAPLFTALAAREAADAAALDLSPRALHTLACHLETLPLAAPPTLHEELRRAHDAAEHAWESLRIANTLPARNAARKAATEAAEQARMVIRAVAAHADRMHGTDVPSTSDSIRTAALAYAAVDGTPDEHAAIKTGTPRIHVDCRSDSGTGWTATARITAGIQGARWFVPAHPPIVVQFRKRDGRENAAANARKVIGSLFRVDVPVEYADSSRV